eukprot:569250-Pleurochrysis_carterae.AAC.2
MHPSMRGPTKSQRSVADVYSPDLHPDLRADCYCFDLCDRARVEDFISASRSLLITSPRSPWFAYANAIYKGRAPHPLNLSRRNSALAWRCALMRQPSTSSIRTHRNGEYYILKLHRHSGTAQIKLQLSARRPLAADGRSLGRNKQHSRNSYTLHDALKDARNGYCRAPQHGSHRQDVSSWQLQSRYEGKGADRKKGARQGLSGVLLGSANLSVPFSHAEYPENHWVEVRRAEA